mgnify:CR=1 FL=1
MANPTDPTPPPTSRQPYADSFEAYWQAGFEGILPLPAGQKKPVPAGFTGNHGAYGFSHPCETARALGEEA